MYVLESRFMYMETKCIHDLFCNLPKRIPPPPYKSSHKPSHRGEKKRGAGALL